MLLYKKVDAKKEKTKQRTVNNNEEKQKSKKKEKNEKATITAESLTTLPCMLYTIP